MGIPDSSLLDLIIKVRSWISWGISDQSSLCSESEMAENHCKMCCNCEKNFDEAYLKYHCQRCGRMFCVNCVRGYESLCGSASGDTMVTREAGLDLKSCNFCSDLNTRHKGGRKYSDKIYPSESPRGSPEPPSPCSSAERFDGCSVHDVTRNSVASFTSHPSPASVDRYPSRSDEDEGDDSAKYFFSPYSHDTSDIDSSSVSGRHDFYSFKSVGSSPSDSPSRKNITSNRVGHSVQQEQGATPRSQSEGPFNQEAVLKRPERGTEDSDNTYDCADDLSIFRDQCEKLHKPLDFENNGLIWFPPPPDDEDDEAENNFFSYDDDDDEVGESSSVFSSSNSFASMFPEKEKQYVDYKKPLRAVVQGHFRALVSQLLQGEGIHVGKENSSEDWLDIITTIAWQAANFVKPDTSRGGSMDPGDYVKVKCIASGSPSESALVKGIVCTKNIKHKRMTSQYKNPRLLIIGGALEYQRVANQLASFDTLLQQEIDHLKMVVSKIEAHHPNVLLVEKSVSSYAQEYLLAKEISLVLNVKRPLLERIARCTGALITPSIDRIFKTRLGHCELFRIEKVSEEHDAANQFSKKPSKTLMFFEGCPWRLGCTVLLKGSCKEELKKIKHVIQYAVFAAYHLSLETSFLADEGATLPKTTVKPSIVIPERTTPENTASAVSSTAVLTTYKEVVDDKIFSEGSSSLRLELREQELSVCINPRDNTSSSPKHCRVEHVYADAFNDDLATTLAPVDLQPTVSPSKSRNQPQEVPMKIIGQEERFSGQPSELTKVQGPVEIQTSGEFCSATDSHQSILVSFSSRCVLNGSVCERSRLLRIKFYGCFDKPLGKYLHDDLFDRTSYCRTCKEPAEAHVICYTHQQGNLTINVKRLPSVKLPGERDGKIWMWHRCLRCSHVNGVPPASRRVVMSDAAWGLSFGKFLELSFSNHATANRVASCGHSLQRDCLRYYGFGSVVVFFRYSPIEILSVQLPPSMLQFNGQIQQNWLRKEAAELLGKTEALYDQISVVVQSIGQKITSFGHESSDTSELCKQVLELKDLLIKERTDYHDLLQPVCDGTSGLAPVSVDILELNRLRHCLLIGSRVWDRRLYSLDSLLQRSPISRVIHDGAYHQLNDQRSLDHVRKEVCEVSKLQEFSKSDIKIEQKEEPGRSASDSDVAGDSMSTSCKHSIEEELNLELETKVNMTSLERLPSAGSTLSDKIDSAWTGTDQSLRAQLLHVIQADGPEDSLTGQLNQIDNPPFRSLMSPARVYSFDSAVRIQERIRKGLPPSSLHLSTLRSFHAFGDYMNMVRDPTANVQRTYSHTLPREAQKLITLPNSSPSIISSASILPEGARLLLPPNSLNNIVIAVYDSEPTSIISYAISSKEYEDWVANKPTGHEGERNTTDINNENPVTPNLSAWQSFGSLDLDYIHYVNYGSEDVSTTISAMFTDSKSSPHLRVSFEDESSNAGGKVKFTVTCYFAKEFDALRKKCCPSEVDFIRSLSRCKRWTAQGGKSNVFFAKSLDERFIIKQVTKTELDSFEEFAPEYFKYLSDSLNSGSPTCLAKVLGIYQVIVKHSKGGKESKMDLMVMENLFYRRNISRVYDLKGSARSRYNADTSGMDKVLLDLNLLEALRTKPIFLGSKAKRSLERAVWNDTSFLASVAVMDYSLLVGVDDERQELVLGIIDFIRQYTWDKHFETWVKASETLELDLVWMAHGRT
ncbi:hypothetical protein RJ639_029250, partial [Escallonia herrerae]